MVEFEPEQLARRILTVLFLVFGVLVVPTQLYIIHTGTVVIRFWKRSLNYRFLLRFSIVFKHDHFFFGKNDRFWKRLTHFELLENELRSFLKTIVFIITICDRFLYNWFLQNDHFWKNNSFWKKIFIDNHFNDL